MQQRLMRLGHEHLVHFELLNFCLIGELSPEAPKEKLLHDVL